MLRKLLIIFTVMIMGTCWVSGCKKSEPSAEEAAKTVEEFKAEADDEISKENLDEELKKLEAEMATETSE